MILAFFHTVFETHTQEAILIISTALGAGFLATYIETGNIEKTTAGNTFSKLKNELSRLRSVLENKDKQLKNANELIKKQQLILIKHDICISEKLQKFEKLLNSILLTENDWQDFQKVFDKLHYGFLPSLKMKYPELTEGEKRLVVLIKLKLSNKEMARMLGISPSSITKSRYRLKKKICKSNKEKSVEDVILEI